MKKKIQNNIFFLIFLITISFSKEKDPLIDEFKAFMKKYNKHYSSESEFENRLETYRKNKYRISSLNENSKGVKYKINEFADMTEEEFIDKNLNMKMNEELVSLKEKISKIPEIDISEEELPENFDWTEKGLKTKIKRQGDCGGCWAFSTNSLLEAKYKNITNKTISLSEQELIDCSTTNNGCKGGAMEKSFKYLMTTGVGLEKHYKFEERDELPCRRKDENAVVKVKNFQFISDKEVEMKKALIKYGPLAGAVNSYPLMFYSEGIYEPSFSWFCPPMINHAIVIVGYGEENGKKFWKVQNSWGDDWGENGYFRLIRGTGACGINVYTLTAEAEVIKVVEEDQ